MACAHGANLYCSACSFWGATSHTWTWPSTTYVTPEFSDTGYVGKHRA